MGIDTVARCVIDEIPFPAGEMLVPYLFLDTGWAVTRKKATVKRQRPFQNIHVIISDQSLLTIVLTVFVFVDNDFTLVNQGFPRTPYGRVAMHQLRLNTRDF